MLCLVAQSCPTLCDPKDSSLSGSSVLGILQARILEWVAIPSSRESSPPRDQTQASRIAGRFFTTEPPGKPFLRYHRSPKISEPVNCCRNLRHCNNSLLDDLTKERMVINMSFSIMFPHHFPILSSPSCFPIKSNISAIVIHTFQLLLFTRLHWELPFQSSP